VHSARARAPHSRRRGQLNDPQADEATAQHIAEVTILAEGLRYESVIGWVGMAAGRNQLTNKRAGYLVNLVFNENVTLLFATL